MRAFVSLGGNFLRAIPETDLVESAWRKLRLTVNVATKLNRTHLMDSTTAFAACMARAKVPAAKSIPVTVRKLEG